MFKISEWHIYKLAWCSTKDTLESAKKIARKKRINRSTVIEIDDLDKKIIYAQFGRGKGGKNQHISDHVFKVENSGKDMMFISYWPKGFDNLVKTESGYKTPEDAK